MNKHELKSVIQKSDDKGLYYFARKYRKGIMGIVALLVLGTIMGLAYDFYGDYQEHQPLDMSQMRYDENEVRQLISEKMADATITELELDREKDHLVYEVTAFVNGVEKEFKVDAMTGDISEGMFDF